MSGLLVREKLGAGLRGVRRAAGLTGAALAAELDISQATLSGWRRASASPTPPSSSAG
ncbi:helix-turn-helix domain-containing protein [Pseudonocardia kujensis]|uniref:helix-turn-helix domain-containing protein n=1 Tax=Pseudonocardia kujensis TaxID=1128675 RepID=UPI0035578974